MIDDKVILKRLTAEFDYSEDEAQRAVEKLKQCRPEIQTAFETWWKSGVIPDLQVEGFTLPGLMQKQNWNPIQAFLALDWLMINPKVARTVLRRGLNTIVFSNNQEKV